MNADCGLSIDFLALLSFNTLVGCCCEWRFVNNNENCQLLAVKDVVEAWWRLDFWQVQFCDTNKVRLVFNETFGFSPFCLVAFNFIHLLNTILKIWNKTFRFFEIHNLNENVLKFHNKFKIYVRWSLNASRTSAIHPSNEHYGKLSLQSSHFCLQFQTCVKRISRWMFD